ncbi:MAG: transposase [Chlorobiaceae bacterium]|nr:transposase [Chlorobiaceae bacterium]
MQGQAPDQRVDRAAGLNAKRLFNRVHNAYIERINSRLRDEWLNINCFMSLNHAREAVEAAR